MNEIIYQKIFDEIQNDLPEQWNKIILFVAYTEGSYSMKYYCTFDGKGYVDCFSLNGGDSSKLIRKFMKIDGIISAERKALTEDKRWAVMTMIVDADGGLKVEYDYSDVSEKMISYEESWKKKYLQ